MLDLRNRELAEITRADDFIVSDRLASLMLAQVSENKDRAEVFANLLSAEGAEIYFRPAGDYVRLGTAVNFYTVVASARRHNQVAIGYRLQKLAHSPAETYGVVINPRKAEQVTFADGDKVIIVAEC